MTPQSLDPRYDAIYQRKPLILVAPPTVTFPTLPTTGTRDGDQIRYKALATATGADADVWWIFTYDAAAAYWYCTSGDPLQSFKVGGSTSASLTYVAPGTAQEITLPFAGDYYVSLSANLANNTGGDGALASYTAGATAASDSWAVGGANIVNVTSGRPYYLHTGLLAADKIAFRYRAFTGGTATCALQILNVLPLRVH